jgi:predicted esterase YcpF (UPF0227 family)
MRARNGKPGPTSGGYYGEAVFQLYKYPPAAVVLNVSIRPGPDLCGEIDSVANDFVPTHTVCHPP